MSSSNDLVPSASMEQQTLDFYTAIKTKISNRYGSFFVRDIPGTTGFTMWWFAKKGGRAVVNVLLREAFGLRIEFTRNTVSGISSEAGTADAPAMDVVLNDGCLVKFKWDKESGYVYGLFRTNARYSERKNAEKLVSEVLGTLLQA